MNKFLFALTFLTRIPSPVKVNYNEQLPSQSMMFYPMIGTIIGLLLIILDILFSLLFTKNIINILLLSSLIYITGGLHLDGFIDTVDGVFSCREKEKILEIMHDSLIGSFGAIAIIVLLFLKFNLFLELSNNVRYPLFLLMPSISRFLAVIAVYKYPLATSSKLGKGFNYYLRKKELIFVSIYLSLLSLAVYYIFKFNLFIQILIIILSFLIMSCFSKVIISKIDGLTGDVYGAIIEITEVTVLLSYLVVVNFISI